MSETSRSAGTGVGQMDRQSVADWNRRLAEAFEDDGVAEDVPPASAVPVSAPPSEDESQDGSESAAGIAGLSGPSGSSEPADPDRVTAVGSEGVGDGGGGAGATHIQAELELAAEGEEEKREGAGGSHGREGDGGDDDGGLERPALTFAAQPRPVASWKPCEGGGSTGGSVTLEFKQGGGYTSYFAPRVQPGGSGSDALGSDGADDLGEDDGLPS